MTPIFRSVKDMSISHADFWRLFPGIDPPSVHDQLEGRIGSQDFSFDWRGGSIQVLLSDEGVRQIAALCLPRTLVTMIFTNLHDQDIDDFIQAFHRRFQRAGG